MPADRDYELYWRDLKASHDAHPGNIFRYGLIRDMARECGMNPATVVDCGCGDGSLLRVMRTSFPKASLCGMDVSVSALMRVSESGLTAVQTDLGQPLRHLSEFDLVLCSEAIEHIEDDETVLDNLAKLCGTGGFLILTTQSGPIYNTEKYLGHIRHYRLEELASRLESRSFRIVCSFQAGWPWLPLQKIAAHHMQSAVRTHVVETDRIAPWLRLTFRALAKLYRLSSRSRGPQLLLVAKRVAPC